MNYNQIMNVLKEATRKMKTVARVAEWSQIASELVDLHNSYCNEMKNWDNIIYPNDEEYLVELLPQDPLAAFAIGQHANYCYTDSWLTLDGYGNPVTTTDTGLLDNFLFISDLADWLAEKEEDEQKELLKAFSE